MKKKICCFTLLLIVLACQQDNANAQPTHDKQGQNGQQDKIVDDGNKHREPALAVNWSGVKYEETEQSDTGVPAHRFQLLEAEKAEEVSEGVFLVGWIRASLSENECEVQIIPVEMDEPQDFWIHKGLQKLDVNFDGYMDIAILWHGGSKWGREYFWLYDPETKRFYSNCLTKELSGLTCARLWTVPKTREIKMTRFWGAYLTEYTYKIVEEHLALVAIKDRHRAKYWKDRGYTFDMKWMTAYQMDKKAKDISRARYWKKRGYIFDPNSMTAYQMDMEAKIKDVERAKYWGGRGYVFDPYWMDAYLMDQKVKDIERVNHWKQRVNTIGMKLVYIPAAEFMMGSRDMVVDMAKRLISEEPVYLVDEHPRHRVKITKGLYMGATEVTQFQYFQIMYKNPSHFKGEDNPVETVSWNDAAEFCKRLSKREGKTYRLPTEAEWEYACRAGTTTPFYIGETVNTSQANIGGSSGPAKGIIGKVYAQTMPVGSFSRNDFGLYDMHGNVHEWCQDWYDAACYANSPVADPQGPSSGTNRVLRGGSWATSPPCYFRSAHRDSSKPDDKDKCCGFRVVLDLDYNPNTG